MNKERLLKSVRNNLLFLAAGKKEKENLNLIIEAMQVIDRTFFVENIEDAYYDTALSIGYYQTISQPSTVARMLMLSELKAEQDLIELGAGSGWNASLMGFMVYPGKVLSLDIVPQLIEKAQSNLNSLKKSLILGNKKRLSKIEFKVFNILKELDTWQEQHDRIIITAGINQTQEDLIYQLAERVLKEQGILVCPYAHGPLIILKKENGKLTKNTTSEFYAFVPLMD